MDDRPEAERVGLRYLSTAYRVRRVVDEHMMAGGLSLARTKALRVLDRKGPLRQASLAAELGMAARSVTQAVEALERDGLIKRGSDPADGRAKMVVLTEEGSKALAMGTAAGEQVLQRIFGALGQKQLDTLDTLLTAVDDATAAL